MRLHPCVCWAALAVALCGGPLARGEPPAPGPAHTPATTQPDVGRSRVVIPDRSPRSQAGEIARRFRLRLPATTRDYDIAGESFEIYIPASPRPGPGVKPLGLLIWIQPGDDGAPPRDWLPVLDRHHLIWIGANKSGNERYIFDRLGLAIDAAEYAAAHWNIDKGRIYVGGVSGGGRCASMIAPSFPDVFRGGFYVVGCNYFRALPVPGNEDQSWRPYFAPPEPKLMDQARKGRYVLLTGQTDANRLQTLSTCENGYKKDGFEHVTYIEVPGMGHGVPDAEWFGKGIVALTGKD